MPDRKPPRVLDDERAVVMSLFQFQRESFVRKVTGVDEARARWSPVASGTSLWWLTTHLVAAEQLWFVGRFAGSATTIDVASLTTLGDAITGYRSMWSTVEAVIAGASLDDPCRCADNEPVPTLRWVIAHMLEETARHAGHADIIRELIDGDTGR